MYVSIEHFVNDYLAEVNSTQKLLDRLTDESLKQEVAPGYRTLGSLAWHLVPSGNIVGQAGLLFDAPEANSQQPQTAFEIAQAYRAASASLIDAVRTKWTGEELQDEHDLFGQTAKKGQTLLLFVKHEAHHRGQLTVLMRQAGLPVSGVYGPSKEEWGQFGMEAPN